MQKKRAQISKLLDAAFVMIAGILVFKIFPMEVWGYDILFDASAHVIAACFTVYFIWFFVDQNEEWHIPFYIFTALVLFVIAIQRILANAHNDVGLLLGFVISILAIAYAERRDLGGKLEF